MTRSCILCRRRLGLLELVYDALAGSVCEDCDSELPAGRRPSDGAVIAPIRGPHIWPDVPMQERRAMRADWRPK